jgi:hypothetical protein
MKLLRFEVSNTPHLTITGHSDLEVNGGREGEVAIKVYGDPNDLDVQREGERFTLTLRTRCKVACPQATTLTIPQASGNLRVRRVDGPLAVEQVHGDTVLRDVGPTTIVQASGNVSARSVQGDLGLEDVSGDVSVRGVEGKLSGDIKGNLKASYVESGLEVQVSGDCSLKTDFTPDCDYLLTTSGNASLNFPAQASARIKVTTHGNLQHKVDWAEIEQISEGTLSGRVGQGPEARVEIEASGDVSLRGRSETGAFVFGWAVDDEFDEGLGIELESMAEELERNIEMHMARMEAKLKDIDQEAIRRKATRAAEVARRKALRAAERARIKAERAERRWERMSPRHSGSSRYSTRGRGPSPPTPPPPPPVTQDERMMVLRMVQEGKITADEGARLLEAMEG